MIHDRTDRWGVLGSGFLLKAGFDRGSTSITSSPIRMAIRTHRAMASGGVISSGCWSATRATAISTGAPVVPRIFARIARTGHLSTPTCHPDVFLDHLEVIELVSNKHCLR
jgi:hypothetical protein